MRTINNLVYHCTATNVDATVSGILRYWREHNGWKNPGYHLLLGRDGEPYVLSNIKNVTNGVSGHNHDSIHISYIGGIDEDGNPIDNRTPEQIQAQIFFGKAFKKMFKDIEILGHRDFAGVIKDCPSFDVKSDLVPYIECEHDDMDFTDENTYPFETLLRDVSRKYNRPRHPYEQKLYDAFMELTTE